MQGENKKVGRGIIIVNESFEGHKEQSRIGAKVDQRNFQEIYDKLNIDYKDNSYFDLNVTEMWKCLKEFASDPMPKNSTIFVAIATHSEQMGEITGRDSAIISLTHIFNFFYLNKSLLNIPKVFLIQASRYIRDTKPDVDLKPPTVRISKAVEPPQAIAATTAISDTLIVHSNLELRSKEQGSFFIQELRDTIHNPDYSKKHFEDIIILCADSVMSKNFSQEEIDNMQERTSCQSTLKKKLHFKDPV